MQSLFLEGVLVALRTPAALVAALAAGALIGASGRSAPAPVGPLDPTGPIGPIGARGLAAGGGAALAGAALGAFVPRLAGADALSLVALGAALLACALITVARAPTGTGGAAALGAVAAFLGAQAALARFLPGELPASVPAGVAIGLALATALPAAAVRLARDLARTPGPARVVGLGTRVLGSWIGAVTLLLLALALAPR